MSRQNKRLVIGIAIILLLVFCFACIAIPACFGAICLGYPERVANIDFPDGLSQIDISDNLETAMVFHFVMPQSSIQGFLDQHQFQPMRELPYNPIEMEVKSLRQENQTMPARDQLWLESGCRTGNSWLFVVEPSTGRLWGVVKYPDASGDSPPCF